MTFLRVAGVAVSLSIFAAAAGYFTAMLFLYAEVREWIP